MNKRDKIAFYKRQIESSEQMKSVAMMSYNLAAQIESEAQSALEVLGATSKRTRKGEHELSDEMKISLISSLTK